MSSNTAGVAVRSHTEKSLKEEIAAANQKAVERILEAEAILTDLKPAIRAIPGFREDLVTHAGPPIEWERMCKPQKLAVLNAIRYEGLADTQEEADRLVRTGEVLVEPNHNYNNVSGMCGVTSASMPVLIVEDRVHGNRAFDWQQTDMTSFGQSYEDGVKEIQFVQNTLAPVMAAAIKVGGGLNVKQLLAQGLQMGDELHGIFDATRGVFLNWILPHLLRTDFPKETLAQVGDYFSTYGGRWYCGNMMMGACKVMMDAARGIKYSTIVTAMSRNGVEFGIKVSGLGDRWFLGPASEIKGFMFPGFRDEESTLDIGDSAISESRGLGGTALPASPSQARLLGENFQSALEHTRAMREVSTAEDPLFRIPYMNFTGVPVGIDVRKVVQSGTVPKIDTGMAHKEGGHGIIGTGISEAPMVAFKKALVAFGEQYS
ncbi:MAG TPA: DUF1116 domain-containing protein [Nitrososphaerales archaeon]|nr:DUF1116 domain-containing protein [Nitrososphaerales archaeon]